MPCSQVGTIAVRVTIHVVGLYWWTDAFWLVLRVYWIMELAYGTQSTAAPILWICNLGLFAVIKLAAGFLALPCFWGCIRDNYCTCIKRAVPLLYIVLASLCSEEANKPANSKQPYVPAAHSQASPDLAWMDRQTNRQTDTEIAK